MKDDVKGREAPRAEADAKQGVIDCDIHPRLGSPEEMKPYLSQRWWDYLTTYGMRRRHGYVKGHPYPKSQPADGMRRDAWPPGGGTPGSDLKFMQEQHLDPMNVKWGLVNPLGLTGQGELHHDFGTALAAAANDWQLDYWTDRDPRLRASILVNYEDPEPAAEEIRRRAGDPRFAHVMLLSRTAEALGRRRYWPIYRAAAEAGLPIGIHVFGYSGWPSTNTGHASYYVEEMTEHETSCSALISSMVVEGLFEELPGLKVAMIEAGFAWLPALAWRLDTHWTQLKTEVPHLRMAPSEYIRRNVWVSTQPMEEPEDKAHLRDVIDWIGHDKVMFASDYPHWDYDDPEYSLSSLPPELRRKILFDNAKALYDFG